MCTCADIKVSYPDMTTITTLTNTHPLHHYEAVVTPYKDHLAEASFTKLTLLLQVT